jgi:uncharacterized phage-like protein YoqJ
MKVAFSGHRSDKIGGFKIPNPTYLAICRAVKNKLEELKPTEAITGMALGVDQIAANICIKLNIPFTAAIPCDNQDKMWPLESKQMYQRLLTYAKSKVIVSPGQYTSACMQRRNEYMCDWLDQPEDVLIAVWNGDKTGGTTNCVDYAVKTGKKIVRIDPTKLRI